MIPFSVMCLGLFKPLNVSICLPSKSTFIQSQWTAQQVSIHVLWLHKSLCEPLSTIRYLYITYLNQHVCACTHTIQYLHTGQWHNSRFLQMRFLQMSQRKTILMTCTSAIGWYCTIETRGGRSQTSTYSPCSHLAGDHEKQNLIQAIY